MNELIQRGITLLKAGDRATARKLLAAAVQHDTHDATAWLWLAAALDNDADRIACLRQVLKIDPQNQAAQRGLAQMLQKNGQAQANPPAAAPAPAAPVQAAPVEAPPAPAEVSETSPAAYAHIYDLPAAAQINLAAQINPAAEIAEPSAPAPSETAAVAETTASAEAAAIPGAATASDLTATADTTATDQAAIDDAAARELRKRRKAAAEAEAEAAEAPVVIFRTRPSQVPALICFWLFLIGAVVVGSLLGQVPEMSKPIPLTGAAASSPAISINTNTVIALVLGLILELVVVYVIIRNFAARYELTNQRLTVRFRGKRARVPVEDLISAECRQNGLQKLFSTGTVELEAAVNGQLAHLRLRDIAQCDKRVEQINSVIVK